jgi:hypothetical protein
MTAPHDGPSGLDALMAAITDETLPDEARTDPAFLAEHRSARADLAVLREQLELIGHALGDPRPTADPAPVRPSRTRRRAFTLAFGGLAVASGAAVLAGMAWLLAQAGGAGVSADSGSDSAASKQESGVRFGSPRYLACARTVAEGTVTRVERLPGEERIRVTVRVTRFYQPERGADELSYVIDEYDVPRPLQRGVPVLFGVPRDTGVPDHWAVGDEEVARERAWITASLPQSRGLDCG